MLPSIGDLNVLKLNYDNTCAYLGNKTPIALKQGNIC